MTPAEMHAGIRADLIANAEPHKLPTMQRYFKEPIDAYCAYTVHVRNLARQHGAEFASWPSVQRDALTTALWESGKYEEGTVAILLYARMRRKCGLAEWKLFRAWLQRYIRNWAHCDTLCADVLGPMLIAHSEWIAELSSWAAAPALYQRRAALVAPLKGIRKGLFRQEAEHLLTLLGSDREDMVKKGIVWLRKEMAR